MRAPLVLLVVASFPAAACSLIVQFHDQSTGGGDDASVVESGPAPEAATQDSGVLQDSSGGDSMAAIDTFAPCLGKANGFYCGNNGLGPGLPPEDIVHCINDGSVGTAISCGDAGCLHVVDPFPDACNPCFGVADGAYCGRDLAGFPAYSADILLQCTSGSTTQQTACAAGCHSIGTMSVCY